MNGPDVIVPGVEALRWAAERRHRCADFWRDPAAVRAVLGSALGGADDLWEAAGRHVLDAACGLDELADRLARRPAAAWSSGAAAAFFTAVDVDWIAREAALLDREEAVMPLPESVMGTPEERHRVGAALRALARWLGPYLDRHP